MDDTLLKFRTLSAGELRGSLFRDFIRLQTVTGCLRKINGRWVIRDDPFVDDWTDEDIGHIVSLLKRTIASGGFVYAAFYGGKLKGFVSAERALFGGEQQYCDLSCLYVSAELRRCGIGKSLFLAAKHWAKQIGAKKLYISAHSAVESQAFYHSMGCVEAEVYHRKHVEDEPFDCQLECRL